jgi:hypothetical protein
LRDLLVADNVERDVVLARARKTVREFRQQFDRRWKIRRFQVELNQDFLF